MSGSGFGHFDIGGAMVAGEFTAKEIVTIATSSDMGDIREDATAEALRRLMKAVPEGTLTIALAEVVKLLAIGLSVYSDISQGRDPMNPTQLVGEVA